MPRILFDVLEASFARYRNRSNEVALIAPASRWSSSIAIACLMLLVAFLVAALPWAGEKRKAPPFLLAFVDLVGLQQSWSLFAPRVRTEDGWIVAAATFQDGTSADVWQNQAPITFTKPASIGASYRNKRWREHLTYAFFSRNGDLVEGFAHWVRSDWNLSHPDNPIRDLKIYFLLRDSAQPMQAPIPVRIFPLEGRHQNGKAIFSGDPRHVTKSAP